MKNIVYCGYCSFPAEYCEYSGKLAKCKEWLREHAFDEFRKLFPAEVTDEELSKSVKEVRIEDYKEEEKPVVVAVKAKGKGSTKPLITIKRTERNKRKCITSVSGMETFGIDLKKAAKSFASKFACGSSVSKTAAGTDEIVIQGDVQDVLVQLIMDTWNVPKDGIVIKQK